MNTYPVYSEHYYREMEKALENKEDTQAKFQKVMLSVTPKRGETLLDVGCGTGHYLVSLALSGADAIGVDFSNEALKIAMHLGKKRRCSFSLVRCDAEKLPFRSEYFDKVLMVDTIEHLKNPINSLREIHRTLKVDGELIITTMPNNIEVVYVLTELLRRLRVLRNNFLDEKYHLKLFNPIELKRCLKRMGFFIEKVSMYRILAPLFHLMRTKRNNYLDNRVLCNSRTSYVLGHGILIKSKKVLTSYD